METAPSDFRSLRRLRKSFGTRSLAGRLTECSLPDCLGRRQRRPDDQGQWASLFETWFKTWDKSPDESLDNGELGRGTEHRLRPTSRSQSPGLRSPPAARQSARVSVGCRNTLAEGLDSPVLVDQPHREILFAYQHRQPKATARATQRRSRFAKTRSFPSGQRDRVSVRERVLNTARFPWETRSWHGCQ